VYFTDLHVRDFLDEAVMRLLPLLVRTCSCNRRGFSPPFYGFSVCSGSGS